MSLTLIKIVDQIQFDPETAQLAALARSRGQDVDLILSDYGTDEKAFLGRFSGGAPELVLMRLTRQTFEVQQHVLAALRERLGQFPVAVYGPMVLDAAELSAKFAAGPLAVLKGDSESALEALFDAGLADLGKLEAPAGLDLVTEAGEHRVGEDLRPRAADDFPNPDYGVFGGSWLFRRGIGGSFFGEMETAPFELGVGRITEASANAGLESFARRQPGDYRLRSEAQLADRLHHLLRDFPELRRIEIRDLNLPLDAATILGRLMKPHLDRIQFSMRMTAPLTGDEDDLRNAPTVEQLTAFQREGIGRFVFEWDALDEVSARTHKGLREPALTSELIHAAIGLGAEVGVLVSVGLPDETPANIEDKISLMRQMNIDRVRFVPFEPRFQGPLWERVEKSGLLPSGDLAWNREVYHPLEQDCMPLEDWYLAWQKCLDYQAELSRLDAEVGGVS